jgi:hypothetical protein
VKDGSLPDTSNVLTSRVADVSANGNIGENYGRPQKFPVQLSPLQSCDHHSTGKLRKTRSVCQTPESCAKHVRSRPANSFESGSAVSAYEPEKQSLCTQSVTASSSLELIPRTARPWSRQRCQSTFLAEYSSILVRTALTPYFQDYRR